MEHDIGCKIKAARIEKKLTQEQVAELLGVSRQTISNWENEKSYPDIISVIKMSECYDVSLDYLLKGEQKMKSYYDYLEESTNVVKSNANRNKIITILSYLLIWAFAMIVFWFFASGSDAMGYSSCLFGFGRFRCALVFFNTDFVCVTERERVYVSICVLWRKGNVETVCV